MTAPASASYILSARKGETQSLAEAIRTLAEKESVTGVVIKKVMPMIGLVALDCPTSFAEKIKTELAGKILEMKPAPKDGPRPPRPPSP